MILQILNADKLFYKLEVLKKKVFDHDSKFEV